MNHGREDQNPWTKWYWQDWEADTGLRASSLAAQGLWMRMLSIMARSKKKGFLLDGEKQMESKTLAKLTGEPVVAIETLTEELRRHSVFSQLTDGTIFNRRMVKESEISDIRSRAGHLGGRPKKQNESKSKSKTKAASASAYASASFLFEEFLKTITEADREGWKKAYPACDLDIEIAKAGEWVKAEPAKGRKSNWRKFLIGWFNRSQNAGGTRGVRQERKPPVDMRVGASLKQEHDADYWAKVRQRHAEGKRGDAND